MCVCQYVWGYVCMYERGWMCMRVEKIKGFNIYSYEIESVLLKFMYSVGALKG